MRASAPALPPTAPALPGPPRAGRRPGVWALVALALLLDVGVCVPFVYDPWGWRDTSLAAPGAPERIEYVVFLAAAESAAERARFFAAHPQARVEHESAWGGTLVVSLPAQAQALAGELRRQPFVRLLSRGGVAFCRSI